MNVVFCRVLKTEKTKSDSAQWATTLNGVLFLKVTRLVIHLIEKEWELVVIFLLACTGTASTLRGVAISKMMKSLQDAALLY